MLTAAPLATLILVLSFTVFFAGRDLTYLPLAQLQTLIFVMLVFTGLGNVYLVRECHHFWQSRPSRWLMSATALDLAVVCIMASQGILMTAISPVLITSLLGTGTCLSGYDGFPENKPFSAL
jgi:H+-transporting ATPase